jgi:hypothetical protein
VREKVEEALKKVLPIVRGAGASVRDVKDGIVTLDIVVSSCGASIPKEMVLEILGEELKDEVPEIKEVVAA